MTDHETNERGSPSSGIGAPADLGPRILARLIDYLILGAVLLVISAFFVALSILGSVGGVFGGGFGLGTLVFGIIEAAIVVGYFAVMESQRGQTVGKMVMGLETQGPNGGKPTTEEAVKRNAWNALNIIPILGGLLQLGASIYIMMTINQSPTKTGWHDQFAGGTKVIKIK
jgi:uncharacterized RDD family membrane protein YckC